MTEYIVNPDDEHLFYGDKYEELIRCRDCKNFAGEGMYCDFDIMVHYDHFYCYHGERKEGEADES